MLAPMDLAILFGVALVVFGPKRLPELGKSLGQGIGNFKKAVTDAQEEVSSAVKTEPKQAIASAPQSQPANKPAEDVVVVAEKPSQEQLKDSPGN
jgi:sec-independent protein translocase protein TatA